MLSHILQVFMIGFHVALARQCRGRLAKIMLGVFASSLLMIGVVDAVFIELSGSSFNDGVWFHLRYGLQGADINEFKPLIIKISLGLTCGLLLIWPLAFTSSTGKRSFISSDRWLFLAGCLALSSSIALHPLSHAVWKVLHPPKISEPLVDFYMKPEIQSDPGITRAPLPNLVWIYAESLERTYLDESLFPGLTPGLKELESESATFTNIDQYDGATWTIAGMVASQCGIPLVTTGGNCNSMHGVNSFLPGVRCLGDLLKEQRYSLTFMGGAELSFAGKGSFYKSHGFSEVLGRHELEPHLADSSYVNGWGLYDDSLFDFVREKYRSLRAAKKEPFALVALTIDTHHPDGHMSRYCDGLKYQDGGNSMLNAVHCSDRLISKLVKDIRSLDRDNSTVIVVSSDHLAMPNSAYEALNSRPRRNLFVVNWPGHVAPMRVDRRAGTFALAPTILGVMGLKTAGLGLGRDLLASSPTLAESFADVSNVVASWLPQFKKAWQLPQAVKEIRVLPKTRKMIVDTLSVSWPVLMSFNASQDLTQLVFPDPEDIVSLAKMASEVGESTTRILVDECQQLKVNFPELDLQSNTVCLWSNQQKAPIVVKDEGQSFSIAGIR